MRRLAGTAALIGLGALVAACTGGPGGEEGPAEPPSPAGSAGSARPYSTASARPSVSSSPHALVKVADSTLGRILVDAEGRTLYLFEKDQDGVPGCYGDCAATWPPYLTQGAPEAGEGASADLLGTAERTDGTTQVAYAGRPLYRHVRDAEPGDTTGNAVEQFGAGWHAVTPRGNRP